MQTLDRIGQWPVDNASAAVVDGSRGVAHFGDGQRIYPLASVTKLLCAYATLVAVEEGAVELDQPAGPPGATVRHLLAHASGLAFGENRVQAEPGAKRIYSSAGFEVLADFVEAETGIAYPDYVAEAVFQPLGMATAALVGPAGHGAQAGIDDLSRFAAELLRPTLVSPQMLAEATAVQFPGLAGLLPGYGPQRPNDWGLGFEIKNGKSPHWTGTGNSPATYGHFGQSGTFLWVDPALDAACVVLTDRAFGDWAKPLWTDLSDAVATELRGRGR
ncbi:serine hydrolase domain-containing protein [Prescottella equi]|uniref:serine hydrolase domain-containing protein n=1 Tax=Rhodococcus hoagii TaxID=43767 RepID=UPI0009BE8725|nr:serine hydrolase domain-containing protein [Prescottella equi]MBM4653523.1 serine hydrolase [Prescottella equi]MBM4731417.1 serine hydrolase [Prescottella equi]OQQ32685.1 serine hydrolase [Prescottella equi]ORM08732.1 serine hydrolase [Prescottella equi]